MSEPITCPRRAEGFGHGEEGKDSWREDNTCSFCGSLNPAEVLARVEAGTATLGPTDKNYKVYVKNSGGDPFKQTYRNCPRDSACKGPNDCAHWVTRPMQETKAYFQHFSKEQCLKFIDLLNAKKLRLGYPGHFYVRPFFIAKPQPPAAEEPHA